MKKIIILFTVLLTGCSVTVNSNQLNFAEKACKEHEGVAYLSIWSFPPFIDSVMCNDNTYIKYEIK